MRVVVALATRPSTARVSVTARSASVTFWWMRLLANRVSDDVPTTAATSASSPSPTRASVRSHTAAARSAGDVSPESASTIAGP